MGASPSTLCAKCEQPKEASRAASKMCRACDAAARARRTTGTRTAMRRLTLDLPVDVWDRLDAEARVKGQRIAGYTQLLIVTRDEKKQNRAGASPSTETGDTA